MSETEATLKVATGALEQMADSAVALQVGESVELDFHLTGNVLKGDTRKRGYVLTWKRIK